MSQGDTTSSAVRPAPDPRRRLRRLWQGLVLAVFAVAPAVAGQFFTVAPQDRYIHIESFRYGKEPSVIRVNRGDRLHLTFSTRDTRHSFFLEEMDVDAKIDAGHTDVLQYRTSDPQATPLVTETVTLTAEHPGWLNYLVSKSLYRCHIWCGPMHAFEHGNLVIWPNTLLLAGLGLLAGIPIVSLMGVAGAVRRGQAYAAPVTETDGWNLLRIPGQKYLQARSIERFSLDRVLKEWNERVFVDC
jgi:hypothetical protein